MSTSNPAVAISIGATLGTTFETTLGQAVRRVEDFTERIGELGRTKGLALLQGGFDRAASAVEKWRAPMEEALRVAGHLKDGIGELAEVQKTWDARIPASGDRIGALVGTMNKYQAMLKVVTTTSEKAWGTDNGFAKAARKAGQGLGAVIRSVEFARSLKDGLSEAWATKILESAGKVDRLVGNLNRFKAVTRAVAATTEKAWGTDNGFAKAARKAEQGLGTVVKSVEFARSLKDGLTKAWATKIPESAGKVDRLVGTLNKYQSVLDVVANSAAQAWGADNGIAKAANAGKEWLATGVQAIEIGRGLAKDARELGKTFIQLGQSQVWSAAKTMLLGAVQKAWAVGSLIVTGACQAISAAFRVMGLAVMANPIGLAIAGIALAAGLVVANWDWVKEKLGQTWEWLKGLFSFSPLGLIIENWEPIKDFFGELWDWVEEKIGAVWQAIKDIPIIGSLFGGGDSPKQADSAAPLGASISDLPVGRPVNVAQASADALPASASALPPRAGDGGMVLNYSPTISIAAGVQNPDAVRAAVDQGLDADKRRLRTMIREIMREEQRLAYA